MDIIPFKGYRYNPQTVGDPGDCIAPPYDVIDAAQQADLYERNACNVVRIIKGKAGEQDNEQNNVYSRAADALRTFMAENALVEDPQEQIYVYSQDFTIDGTAYTRNGFIALGKLQAYGANVKPHEQTLAGPKADRLNLTRAIKTQVGQIFMLYSDPEKQIDPILAQACRAQPLLSHVDDDKVTHKLFAISDPQEIATISAVMESRDIFIADGHHRYETALNYMNESDNPKAGYQMMTFVNTHNEGLVVLPTHRLIKNVAGFSPDEFVGRLREAFDVARLAFHDVVEKKETLGQMTDALTVEFETNQNAFGMYFNDGAFYVVTLKDIAFMQNLAGDHSRPWQQLDVAILHKLALEKHLGIDEAALTAQTNVEYIKDFGDATGRALDRVDEGSAQCLFFMNPTRIEGIEAVAKTGEKMPQKSTFFFPKIYSGLVLNVLEKP